jgi:aspartokinase-like uncharacterized kinase
MNLRVVKLGGSLLDLADLVPRLRAWLAAQPACPTILVVGGGAMVDAIRHSSEAHELRDAAAHWQCIRAMGVQAETMIAALPEAELLIGVDAARRFDRKLDGPPLWILEPWHFLREDDRQGRLAPLPESWDVTSDSIAARVAELSGAEELVLLKSAPPPNGTLEELAAAGYVDRFFPQAARGPARVRFVNLRADLPLDGAATV